MVQAEAAAQRVEGGCAFLRTQDWVVFQERGVAGQGVGCSFDPSGGSVRDPPQGLRKHGEAGISKLCSSVSVS